MPRPKKHLKKITLLTLPNGYAFTVDSKEYLCFSAEQLVNEVFVRLALGELEYMNNDTIAAVLEAAAKWQDLKDALMANAELIASARRAHANENIALNAQAKTNERNGCYDRKRGHPPSEATLKGNLKRWQEERLGLRENALLKMKRENPKKYKAAMEKKRQERKESIRKEKLRIIYGLERKTKLKVVVMTPYTRSQTHHRCNALKRGYLLDVDCSEGQPGRYIIYYDDETQRSERFEKNCIKDGFTFKRDE